MASDLLDGVTNTGPLVLDAGLGGAALALGAHRVVFVPSDPASSSFLL
jgi:hypothetical protein